MRRGFTLIEVLVVLSVIALLAVIVVPSMKVIRSRADSSRCLSNLKNLGVSLNLYLAEHNMMMPELQAARPDKNLDVPVIDNTLNAYVDDVRAFSCPSDRSLYEKTGTSYFWNSALKGPIASLNFLFETDLGKIPILVDKEGWHKHSDNKVNHLYADGHADKELRFSVE